MQLDKLKSATKNATNVTARFAKNRWIPCKTSGTINENWITIDEEFTYTIGQECIETIRINSSSSRYRNSLRFPKI